MSHSRTTMQPPHERSRSANSGAAVIGCISAVAFLIVFAGAGLAGYLAFRTPSIPAPRPRIAVAPPLVPPPLLAPAPPPLVAPAVAPPPDLGAEILEGGTEVRGSLSRDVIRSVVRAHLGEVRSCYEEGLRTDPNLAGRVTVSFVIGPTGAVQTASVGSSTLVSATDADELAGACIARAVRSWLFPTPEGGGIVSVNYPFVFEPAP